MRAPSQPKELLKTTADRLLGNNVKEYSERSKRWVAKKRKIDLRSYFQDTFAYTGTNQQKCGRCMRGEKVSINIYGGNKASYGGIVTCNSVAFCPVCADKIGTRRAEEVWIAIQTARSLGWHCVMVSFAVSHSLSDSLETTRERLQDTWNSAMCTGSFAKLKESIGYKGNIRAWETTLSGLNGWHPHNHVLFFLTEEPTEAVRKEIQDYLFTRIDRRWKKEFPTAKPLIKERCIRVDLSQDHSRYINKMSMAYELTMGNSSKEASRDNSEHLTPFQILEKAKEGSAWHKKKWIEYFNTMKGKPTLRWSKGLKKTLGIIDKTDEELGEEQQVGAVMVYEIDPYKFRRVRANRDYYWLLLVFTEQHFKKIDFNARMTQYIDDLIREAEG